MSKKQPPKTKLEEALEQVFDESKKMLLEKYRDAHKIMKETTEKVFKIIEI